jgi:hypothetical protein
VKFVEKEQHADALGVKHGGTEGTFVMDDTNGRYELPCKQAAGEKTIQVTVRRPPQLTAFGAEWVAPYEKDSWLEVSTCQKDGEVCQLPNGQRVGSEAACASLGCHYAGKEHEPYTLNSYGARIPLTKFRETMKSGDGTTSTIAAASQDFNVYMVMDKVGDYELRYANPEIYSLTVNRPYTIAFKTQADGHFNKKMMISTDALKEMVDEDLFVTEQGSALITTIPGKGTQLLFRRL